MAQVEVAISREEAECIRALDRILSERRGDEDADAGSAEPDEPTGGKS